MLTSRASSKGIVVGGGVIGLSLAWELSKRGHHITVVDQGTLGRGTSWAAAGILPPANLDTATDPIDRLRGFSHRLFPRWHEELLSLTGIDSGFRRCGGWYLADTPGERAAMFGMSGYWHELEIQCERVTAAELSQREPVLATRSRSLPIPDAWWVPDECQIRSPRYLQALVAACRSQSVDFVEDSPVVRIQDRNAIGVQTPASLIQGDFVVLTSGAWTGQIDESFDLQQSLVPVRGQMLLFKSPTQSIRSVINVGNRYLVPRNDGNTLVGSNEEEVGFVNATTPETLGSLCQFAVELCPHLEDAEIAASWSGLRPMTFDGFPMIGRMPGRDNVFVAAGHYRSGIHLSCGTAEVLANLIDGRDNLVDLNAFQVGKQQHHNATPHNTTRF
jgi:glycine oxidase